MRDFLEDLKKREVESFFEEIERDEQLKQDFDSDISEKEKYEIVKDYFDDLSFKEFKNILRQYSEIYGSESDDFDIKYVSSGTHNRGETVIFGRDGKTFWRTNNNYDGTVFEDEHNNQFSDSNTLSYLFLHNWNL